MYGRELRYTRLCNRKARFIFALLGETYAGHIIRFFVNRRYLKRYVERRNSEILEIGSNNGAFSFWLSRNQNYIVDAIEYDSGLVDNCLKIKKQD
jgi:hypothetical protein